MPGPAAAKQCQRGAQQLLNSIMDNTACMGVSFRVILIVLLMPCRFQLLTLQGTALQA